MNRGSDGANLGIYPERALKTILGGEPPPTESATVLEMTAELLRAELDRTSYDGAAKYAARLFLEHLLAYPEDTQLHVDELYDVVVRPLDLSLGLTGFQVGWAVNAARRCCRASPLPNGAIIEIETTA